jgi:hypothetical protein
MTITTTSAIQAAMSPPALEAALALPRTARVLHVGAAGGAALAEWAAHFDAVVGLYADASSAPRAARAAVVQALPSPEIAAQLGDFDVVVDDGSFDPLRRVQALRAFGPGVVGGGGAYVAAPLPRGTADWISDAMREAAEAAGGTLAVDKSGVMVVR